MRTGLGEAADFLAARTGFLTKPFFAERLMAAARARTGLEDFGETPIAEPLQLLLDAAVEEASLGVVGRIALKWDALRFLTNLLKLHEASRREPGIADQPISAPIVITGLPRSGTTFLHRMMLCDPVNRAPLVLETIFPCPEADGRRRIDRREARVARELRTFEWLAPEFHDLHRLTPRSPQECTEILAHSFRSLRFDTTYRIPSYRRWLDGAEQRHLPAYVLHKRFLQYLQPQERPARPMRWVLKCPDHLFAMASLRAVYPDARIVFVHRDPLKVLLSVAKLTEVLRRPFSRRVDPKEIGRAESARWLQGAGRMMDESKKAGAERAISHVHYLDLIADPVATVARVYRHFGLALPADAAAAIGRADRAEPKGGYGRRTYRFDEHGLDAEAEREKFQAYMTYFGVRGEPGDGQARAKRPTHAIEPTTRAASG
ncbi:MAG: sulfotransferase family protein [Acetobacteraceae bacterium]